MDRLGKIVEPTFQSNKTASSSYGNSSALSPNDWDSSGLLEHKQQMVIIAPTIVAAAPSTDRATPAPAFNLITIHCIIVHGYVAIAVAGDGVSLLTIGGADGVHYTAQGARLMNGVRPSYTSVMLQSTRTD